jgi:hypothetical protein
MEWQSLQFYAQQLEWPLFPCHPGTKAPLTPHGFKDASTNLITVKAWYKQHPGCMWATPTSAERGVLDIDAKHDGTATLAALEAEHGTLPLTPKVKTGGGGWHYYFRWPAGTRTARASHRGSTAEPSGGM